MDIRQKENRRLLRLPFSTDEGLVGVVVRPESENEIVIANIIDLSKSGCRILIQKNRKKSYSIDESLILMSLKGTVNLKFSEPIALEVRRINNLPERKALELGCEVTYVSDAAQKMLADFIDRETRWKVSTLQTDSNRKIAGTAPALPEDGSLQTDKAKKPLAGKVPAEGRPRKSRGGVGAILAALAMALALLVFVQLLRSEQAFNQRLDALEAGFKQFQAEVPTTEEIGRKIRTIEERVEVLGLALDGIEAKEVDFEQRLDALALSADAPAEPVDTAAPDTAAVAGPETDPKKSDRDKGIAYHQVQKGENLFRISIKYGTTVEKLCELNDIRPDRPLYLDQKLKVPAPPGDHAF